MIGVAIGAVVFGGGGYLVYNAYQPKQEETTQVTTPKAKTATPSTTKENPTKKDETVDWMTYSNAIIGFLIKYPSDWVVDENPKAQGIMLHKKTSEVNYYYQKVPRINIVKNYIGSWCDVPESKCLQTKVNLGGKTWTKYEDKSGALQGEEIYYYNKDQSDTLGPRNLTPHMRQQF